MGAIFDGQCWRTVLLEPAITVDTIKYEQWMREQRFATRAEAIAYRTITDDWLDAWLWTCLVLLGGEYTRRLALEAAGINADGYARTQRKRGGLASREAHALTAEIEEETRRLQALLDDRRTARVMYPHVTWPRVTLRAAQAAVYSDESMRWLATELRRWHAAKKHARNRTLWSKLIGLREDRIRAVHRAIVAFASSPELPAASSEAASPRP